MRSDRNMADESIDLDLRQLDKAKRFWEKILPLILPSTATLRRSWTNKQSKREREYEGINFPRVDQVF